MDPGNQVVQGSPREVSLTALHGLSNGNSRNSTTADQNQSGSATDRRRNSSKSAMPWRAMNLVVWAAAARAGDGRHTTS